jgi:hypothetical protein
MSRREQGPDHSSFLQDLLTLSYPQDYLLMTPN